MYPVTDPFNYCPNCGGESFTDVSNDPDLCNHCGYHRDRHSVDERTLEPIKCPVYRAETNTPPQESHNTPRGDY